VTPGQIMGPQAVVHVRGATGFLAISKNGGNWYAYARASDREFVTDMAGVQPGRRSHLAAVWDGTQLRLFADGKPSPKAAQPIAPRAHTGSSLLGAAGTLEETAGKPFSLSGSLDEVRVSKVARYTADFTPSERFESDADTLALYHFEEGAGDVLNDASGNGHHGKIVNAKWVPGIADGPANSRGTDGAESQPTDR
jgi:hypothetical protein